MTYMLELKKPSCDGISAGIQLKKKINFKNGRPTITNDILVLCRVSSKWGGERKHRKHRRNEHDSHF